MEGMDVDVGKMSEVGPATIPPTGNAGLAEPASIPTLDGWIESLMACKQLSEADVQRLCDKVRCACNVFCSQIDM